MTVDLCVLGSGFSGSLLALIARRLGLTVALLERGRHPRFAIGESASPLAGVVLEDLADRYDLPRVRPLCAYGTWKQAYPAIGCGLKRGFTYFRHEHARRYGSHPDRSNQLLVAASPNDEVSDTHWFRADVDGFLTGEAAAAGAEYLDRFAVSTVSPRPGGCDIAGEREGRSLTIRARAVIDATGPRGALSRSFAVADAGFSGYPATQALYSHFTGVTRCAEMPEYATTEPPPYAIDAAALHHVFDGGWMWVLRFDTGVTSAGIAVTDAVAADLRLADGAPAWARLLERYPSIGDQFAAAEPVREFTWMPRLPYRAAAVAADRWAMLPSAAAFVDPLFSSGIPMTLLGIERLARSLEQWAATSRERHPDWGDFAAVTLAEADHTAAFVAGCYAGFARFPDFVDYSMFYFAAASYSEMARRLGVASPGFLGAASPRFAAALRALSPAVAGAPLPPGRVAAAIEPLNVAGLCEPRKRNWYGVDLDETVAAAGKFGLAPERVRTRLSLLAEPGRIVHQ